MTDLVERLHEIVGIIEEPFEVDVAAGTATYSADERDFILRHTKAAASTIEALSERIAAEREVLVWFNRHAQHLMNDVSSAHSGRGAGASEWMREDDSDFRSDLREALAKVSSLTQEPQ